jgi:hypothetical protein
MLAPPPGELWPFRARFGHWSNPGLKMARLGLKMAAFEKLPPRDELYNHIAL